MPTDGRCGARQGQRMTCAKQVVKATIVTTDGRTFVGFNNCNRPQVVCPRGDMPSNVGYHLCKEVCGQPGHAEIMALQAADWDVEGATLILEGHKAVCPTCMKALNAAGIARIEVKEKAPV